MRRKLGKIGHEHNSEDHIMKKDKRTKEANGVMRHGALELQPEERLKK